MMFLSDQQETMFFRVLSAYEEEFGADMLQLFIPAEWIDSPHIELFSNLDIRVWKANALGIKVRKLTAKYTMNLGED